MFTPRSARDAAVAPSASSASLRSSSSYLVGGRIGLSGSPALSRHMLGSDSARGVGMGLAAARSHGAKAGVAFQLQPGRARAGLPISQGDLFSVAPLAAGVGAGAGGPLSSRRSHRATDAAAHRAQALASLGSSTSRWRFLKDGEASLGAEVERGFVHNLPIPASIPLTAEGRAYLEAYEAHQAKLAAETSLSMSSGQASQPTFRALLAAQEAAERERSELERVRSEHAAWQRLHGLVPFERFAGWRKDAAASGETVSEQQRVEEESRRAKQLQQQWEQEQQQSQEEGLSSRTAASARTAAEEAAAAVSAGMKTNFMPAVLAATLGVSAHAHPAGAAVTAEHPHSHAHAHHHHHHHHHKHDGRAEFLAQLDQMEREDALKLQQSQQPQPQQDEEKSTESIARGDQTDASIAAPHPKPPTVPRPRSSGRHSAGRVHGSTSSAAASVSSEEKSADQPAPHMPTFGQTDLQASLGAAAAIEASHSEDTAAADAAAALAAYPPPPRSTSSRGRSRAVPVDDADSTSRAAATAVAAAHSHVVNFGEHNAASAAASASASAAADAAAAAASGSSSGSSSRSSSRDSSPVILWRQTNRVKEALDIPQELRSVFLAEPDEAEQEQAEQDEDAAALPGRMKSTAAYKPQPLSALDRIAAAASARESSRDPDAAAAVASSALQELEYNLNPRMQAARQRAKARKVRTHRERLLASMANGALPVQPLTSAALRAQPPPPDSSFTYKLPRAQPPKKYGAWYLPTSLWIAEQKPVFKSPISSRVNVLQPHMSLGSWNARTTSLHGAETLQLGQAEYEEVRRTTGMSGLLSWAELQEREASSMRGGFALGSSVARASLAGRSLVDDSSADEGEADEIDASAKINAIKARAIEARNRRRREAEAKKVANYERARGRKQKAMRAKERAARGGAFSRVDGREDEDSEGVGGEDESEPPSAGLVASNGAAAAAAPALSAASSLEEKLASLKDALPRLEIAQQFKAHIQRLGLEGRGGQAQGSARMPHFLRGVELTPEFMEAQRESARVAAVYEEHARGHSAQHHSNAAIVKATAAAAAFAAAGAAHSAAAAASASAAPLPRHQSTSRSVASSGLSHRVDLRSGTGGDEHKQATHAQRDYRFA